MEINRTTCSAATQHPVKIVQFGEGNFLRAFVDWMICRMNRQGLMDASVAIVKPRPGGLDRFKQQEGLYHVLVQGIKDGEAYREIELVDVISQMVDPYDDFKGFLDLAENPELRLIVSNTTEAGIVYDASCKSDDCPAASFPGKLTQLLYHRYKHFAGAGDKGVVILPCELIFDNAHALRGCVELYAKQWDLEPGFQQWLDAHCRFYNTLVDRIVPGKPKEDVPDLQYDDTLLVSCEPFHLWVIEAPESLSQELPAPQAGLNVKFVPDEKPYHEMKLGLLNATHTAMAPVGLLYGLQTVKETAEDGITGAYVHRLLYDELLPVMSSIGDAQEMRSFADAVMQRFCNPYIKHYLQSIMLNAKAKFVTRDLPQIERYLQLKGRLPEALLVGLAALIVCEGLGTNAENILSDTTLWGTDLGQIPGMIQKVQQLLDDISAGGMCSILQA